MTITPDDVREHLRRTDPSSHGDRSYAVPLVDAMEERAMSDTRYGMDLLHWLREGGTVLLRDELAGPFRDAPFVMEIQGSIQDGKHPYAFDDIWMAVDSARHGIAFERGLPPFEAKPAPTAPADEAPEGCDDEGCPHYGTPHGHPSAPGAHVPNPETVAALEDSRAGRTHRAKDLHDVMVDRVAEALVMRGDGTGDSMRGLQSTHVQKPYDNDAIWAAFYRDGKTLGEIKEEFGLSSIYELTPWLTAPLMNAPDPDVKARAELPKIEVEVTFREWERQGHGGTSKETDYAILLNGHRLRGFSTHGNMQEGYWGSAAKIEAEKYAAAVRSALGLAEEGK